MLSQVVTTVTPEVIDKFRSSLSVKGKSPNTVKAYTTDLRTFLSQAGEERVEHSEFEELGATWLTMNRAKVSPKTTGRRLVSLRAFAKWAGWGDLLTDYNAPDPGKGQPHPIPEGVDGVRRLIAAAKRERQVVLISLCGLCGLRVSEALSIRAQDISTHSRTLRVRGKGDKTRFVPISEEAWGHIQVPIMRSIIEGSEDTPLVNMNERHARKDITTLGERAGLSRRISSHDLRATFATAVYDKTRDIRIVQELLGHASSNQTEIYVGVNAVRVREAVAL